MHIFFLSLKPILISTPTFLNTNILIRQHACQSEGNALYFHGGDGVSQSFASTRDIDLHREEGRSYWEEDFESSPAKYVKRMVSFLPHQLY